MRFRPTSIAGRLALASAVLVLVGLAVAAGGMALTLGHFVRGQLDQRLDAEIASIASVLEVRDGSLSMRRRVEAPPFDRARSGWYWQVRSGDQSLRSASLAQAELTVPATKGGGPLDLLGLLPFSGDGEGPRGEVLHVRVQNRVIDGTAVQIAVSAPARALTGPLWNAVAPAAAAVLVLALALGGASLVQLRLGLKPLNRLAGDVADVRAGRATHLPRGGQPAELQPLVAELNRLIDDNAEGLARARGHAANLGHALNTPLASLALSLAEGSEAEDAARLELVRRMQDRIRHHLGRARTAAIEGSSRRRTDIAAHLNDLLDALEKIHADRHIAVSRDVAPAVMAACEEQDFDEMTGNLLDNACKWAAATVWVSAKRQGATVSIVIEDDGPGLAGPDVARAMARGQRLDETVPGSGFGLPIARELAELYGGSLTLEPRQPAGLRVTLSLPAAA